MSDFKAQALFDQISEGLKGMDDKEKKDIQKKVSLECGTPPPSLPTYDVSMLTRNLTVQTNGVFEMHIKNAGGKELVYTIDLKKVSFLFAQSSL